MLSRILQFLIAPAALVLVAWQAPTWLQSLATIAAGSGLVVLGLLIMWRAGLVSFGQALYFAAGAYTVALLLREGWVTDIFLLLACAGLLAGLLALLVGALLARYREIFFAMLSLAFSMILYGFLVQSAELGSSDGMHVKTATALGQTLGGQFYATTLFLIAWSITLLCALALRWYLSSVAGQLTSLIAENEIRIEYLGYSVRKLIHANLTIAGALAGVGGGITALSIGHVDPSFAYWTTSGEFVFVAILAGTSSVTGVLAGTFLFALLRSTAMSFIPQAWQLILGIALLLTILYVPQGIGSLIARRKQQRGPAE